MDSCVGWSTLIQRWDVGQEAANGLGARKRRVKIASCSYPFFVMLECHGGGQRNPASLGQVPDSKVQKSRFQAYSGLAPRGAGM